MKSVLLKKSAWVVASAMAILIWSVPADGWTRQIEPDWTLVGRAELMVVGAIKDGSVVFEPQATLGNGGQWQAYDVHATLLIRQVLKGKCEEKEIPIFLFALHVNGIDYEGRPPLPRRTVPAGPIEIADTGGGEGDPTMVAAHDARHDAVWMLCRRQSLGIGNTGTGDFGVSGGQMIQPLTQVDYLRSYLSRDPGKALRALVQQHPGLAASALPYFDHEQLSKVLSEMDPGIRAAALLPFLAQREDEFAHEEASSDLYRIGVPACPYLLGLYGRTTDADLRVELAWMMRNLHFAGAPGASSH